MYQGSGKIAKEISFLALEKKQKATLHNTISCTQEQPTECMRLQCFNGMKNVTVLNNQIHNNLRSILYFLLRTSSKKNFFLPKYQMHITHLL